MSGKKIDVNFDIRKEIEELRKTSVTATTRAYALEGISRVYTDFCVANNRMEPLTKSLSGEYILKDSLNFHSSDNFNDTIIIMDNLINELKLVSEELLSQPNKIANNYGSTFAEAKRCIEYLKSEKLKSDPSKQTEENFDPER